MICLLVPALVFSAPKQEESDEAATGTGGTESGTGQALAPTLSGAAGDYPFVWKSASDAEYAGEHRWVWSTPADFEQGTGRKIGSYSESPMLKAMVSSGELPPVNVRLPLEPLVMNPYDEPGEYGGIVQGTGGAYSSVFEIDVAEPLLRCNVQEDLYGNRPRPNVPNTAKDWVLDENYTGITVYLREGMRWSDGQPFTADDIVFWMDDVLLNKELTASPWQNFLVKGEPWDVSKIDDYTVRFDFVAPNPWILYFLATWGPEAIVQYPAHYMKQFHKSYNDKVDELAKEGGFDNWTQLFGNKYNYTLNPELPTLKPYVLKSSDSTHSHFVRNPYYFKVDTEGQQLPYFDELYIRAADSTEIVETRLVTGEVDYEHHMQLASMPLYMEKAEEANFQVLTGYQANRTTTAGSVAVNQTYQDDAVLAEILKDVRFRKALSLSINRDEINDVYFYGKGVPRQEAMTPISMFYEEEHSNAYIDFDLDAANELLDEMGLKWDSRREFRLRSDGEKLAVLLDSFVEGWEGINRSDVALTLANHWKEIGIDASVKAQSHALYYERVSGNQHHIAVGWGSSGSDDNFIIMPEAFVATNCWQYAPLWQEWHTTNGASGERPDDDMIRATELFINLRAETDLDKIIEMGKEIMKINVENLWQIGIVGLTPLPRLAASNMRNIPPAGMWGVAGTWSQDYNYPEQWYFKHPLLPRQQRK